MKKVFLIALALGILISPILAGCAQDKAASSQEAIETAKAMETTEEKVDYLIGQTKAFYNSEEFQEAVNTSKYVLRYLDKNSQEARDLFDKAKAALVEAARGAVEDAKQKVGVSGE